MPGAGRRGELLAGGVRAGFAAGGVAGCAGGELLELLAGGVASSNSSASPDFCCGVRLVAVVLDVDLATRAARGTVYPTLTTSHSWRCGTPSTIS